MCFQMSTLTSLSIMAEVEVLENGVKALKVSSKYLQPDTKLGHQLHGYILSKNKIETKESIISFAKGENSATLWLQRIIFPCVLWLAFYCCLSPVMWVIDTAGDFIENIPCVGWILTGFVEAIESLATCLMCMVSCACGLSVSLLVMGVAWLAYRPAIGISCLVIFILIISGVLVWIHKRKQASGFVGRRRRKNQLDPEALLQPSHENMPNSGGEDARPTLPMTSPISPQSPHVMLAQPNTQSGDVPSTMMAQQSQPVMQMGPQLRTMEVLCPAGVMPGQTVQVSTPEGHYVEVQVPVGVNPGQVFLVQI